MLSISFEPFEDLIVTVISVNSSESVKKFNVFYSMLFMDGDKKIISISRAV